MRKNGTSKASAAQRRALFVDAYIGNGENGTRAAIQAGYPQRSAHVAASRLLKDAKVFARIEKRRAELRARFNLTTDRVVQELARCSYFNPKRLVDAKGKPIPLHQLDDDTAAALASIEIAETEVRGKGKNKVVLTRKMKGRPFNKATVLEKSIKILRLYDKPPPPPPDGADGEQHVDEMQIARRMAFLLAQGAAAAKKGGATKNTPQPKKVRRQEGAR